MGRFDFCNPSSRQKPAHLLSVDSVVVTEQIARRPNSGLPPNSRGQAIGAWGWHRQSWKQRALNCTKPAKFILCLANRYAGRFYLLYESELSLTFGTHLVVGKRSDRRSSLRLGTSERFLGVLPRSTAYRSKGESLISQAAAGVW